MRGQIVNGIFAPSYQSLEVIKIDLAMLIRLYILFKEALCKAEIRKVGRQQRSNKQQS